MIHSPAWLTWPGLASPSPPRGTKVAVNRGRPHPLLALGPRSSGGASPAEAAGLGPPHTPGDKELPPPPRWPSPAF